MQHLSINDANQLLSQNRNHLYVLATHGRPFCTENVAAFIGVSYESICSFLQKNRTVLLSNIMEYEICPLADTRCVCNLRRLFDLAFSAGFECCHIFLIGYGYISLDDTFLRRPNVISTIRQTLAPLPDNNKLYTVCYRDGSEYCIDGHQAIFFSLEAAYKVVLQIDGILNEVCDLVFPFFYSCISPALLLNYRGVTISGYELQTALSERFLDNCMTQAEISDILKFPLIVYAAMDGTNLMLVQHEQALFFTSQDRLLSYDTSVMPKFSEGIFMTNPFMYQEFLVSEYVFFDGARHCRTEDFLRALGLSLQEKEKK